MALGYSQERKEEMNTLIIAISMVLVAVVGTIIIKYIERKDAQHTSVYSE